MQNFLINQIEKIDDINFISNDYKADDIIFKDRMEELKKKYSLNIDVILEDFFRFINGKMFYDWVVFKSITDVPMFKDNIGDIGYFYSLQDGTQYDLFSTKEIQSDIILPTDYLLSEATPGDFLIVSLNKKDYGNVYFVPHDFNENEQPRYLVANNLQELMQNMFLKED